MRWAVLFHLALGLVFTGGLFSRASAGPDDSQTGLHLLGAYGRVLPGGSRLDDLEAGPGLMAGLQADLTERFYLKLSGTQLDPDIRDEDVYVVDEDEETALFTNDYQYRDLCLLAGLNLGRPRTARPYGYCEVGGGIGRDERTVTTIDLLRSSQVTEHPDRVFFVLACGGGIKWPLHRRLAADLGFSWRLHWDSTAGTGFFDPTTGSLVPIEEFEGSAVQDGNLLLVRIGAVWSFF